MSDRELSLFDYIREAFKVQYNLILVAGGFLAGIVSLHPLAVWPLVAALEILYLLTMAHNTRFQAIVRTRLLRRQEVHSGDAAVQLIAALNPPRRKRYESVRERCLTLQQSLLQTSGSGQVGALLENQQTQSVNQLLWVFLRTLAYEQALEAFSRSVPRQELEEDLRRNEAAMADESRPETLRSAYRDNVDVLRRRLENLDRAEENLQAISARLIRVENSMMLIQEQALTRRDPGFIEAEVNSATAGLTSVEQMLRSIDLPAVDLGTSGPAPELLAMSMRQGQTQ